LGFFYVESRVQKRTRSDKFMNHWE